MPVAACAELQWSFVQNLMHACQGVSCMVAMQVLVSHLVLRLCMGLCSSLR